MEGKASNQPAPPRSWRGGKGGRVGQVGRPLRGGGTATERPRHRPFPRLAAVRGAQASWAPFPARCGGSGLGRRGAKGVEESRLVSQRNKWGRAESLSRSHLQLAGRRGASKGGGPSLPRRPRRSGPSRGSPCSRGTRWEGCLTGLPVGPLRTDWSVREPTAWATAGGHGGGEWRSGPTRYMIYLTQAQSRCARRDVSPSYIPTPSRPRHLLFSSCFFSYSYLPRPVSSE